MATAIISAVTGIPVRKDLTMTGEVTLRGKVLPVGGIKHKLLAAYRADITEIILPRDNEKDLEEIPEDVLAKLEIHLVEQMDEVLRYALESEIFPLPEGKGRISKAQAEPPAESGSVAH